MNAYRVKVADDQYGPESFTATFLTKLSKEEAVARLAGSGWSLKGISMASAVDLEDLPNIDDLRIRVDKLIEQRRQDAAERSRKQLVAVTAVPPPPPLPPEPAPGPYVYKMVQVPPTITVREQRGAEAAAYLQGVVNAHAREGWEFYRVDPITVHIPAGSLAAFLGGKAEYLQYHVITFRRPTSA